MVLTRLASRNLAKDTNQNIKRARSCESQEEYGRNAKQAKENPAEDEQNRHRRKGKKRSRWWKTRKIAIAAESQVADIKPRRVATDDIKRLDSLDHPRRTRKSKSVESALTASTSANSSQGKQSRSKHSQKRLPTDAASHPSEVEMSRLTQELESTSKVRFVLVHAVLSD